MVEVTRIPDLEKAIEKVYKKENQANLFVFNLWDQSWEESTGSLRLEASVHKKEEAVWGLSRLQAVPKG